MLVEALAGIRRVPGAPRAQPPPALEPRAALRLAAARAPPRGARARSCTACRAGDARASASRPCWSAAACARRDDPSERDVVLRFITAAGGGRSMDVEDAADGAAPAARRERAPDQLGAPARHGAPGRDRDALIAPGGGFVEHDLDERRQARAGRPAPGHERRRHRRRADPQRHRALPGGHAARGAARRSDARRSARWPSRSAGASSPRSTSPSSSACRVEWFALSAGAKIAMDSGTENMDWIAAVLRRIIEFTQARRRGQRRRHRHQRRRPAVLERRGDDADAHAAASS